MVPPLILLTSINPVRNAQIGNLVEMLYVPSYEDRAVGECHGRNQYVGATDFAQTFCFRQFFKLLSRLFISTQHGESFTLLRDEIPLAEIRPVAARRKLGDLPEILKALPKLPDSEMDDFENDLAEIHRQGNKEQLSDPWES